MSDAAPNLADLADLLSASDDYRVQRRLIPRSTVKREKRDVVPRDATLHISLRELLADVEGAARSS